MAARPSAQPSAGPRAWLKSKNRARHGRGQSNSQQQHGSTSSTYLGAISAYLPLQDRPSNRSRRASPKRTIQGRSESWSRANIPSEFGLRRRPAPSSYSRDRPPRSRSPSRSHHHRNYRYRDEHLERRARRHYRSRSLIRGDRRSDEITTKYNPRLYNASQYNAGYGPPALPALSQSIDHKNSHHPAIITPSDVEPPPFPALTDTLAKIRHTYHYCLRQRTIHNAVMDHLPNPLAGIFLESFDSVAARIIELNRDLKDSVSSSNGKPPAMARLCEDLEKSSSSWVSQHHALP
jgi:hypothetical protein